MSTGLDQLYHAIPLHYLPVLLCSGSLYAQSVLTATVPPGDVPSGIFPRRTASKRDRALGLDDFVHLSTIPGTPLLIDKLEKGYAHAILVFYGPSVMSLPEVAVVPYNTKAWRTRACYTPVTDPLERDALIQRHIAGKRLPSLEVLVKYGLPLSTLRRIAFISVVERDLALRCAPSTMVDLLTVDPPMFPSTEYAPRHWSILEEYFDRCAAEEKIISPPSLPFD